MIMTSSLPILVTVAFSLWGMIIIGVQNIFLRYVHEYKRMYLAAFFLAFLVITNSFFILAFIEGINMPVIIFDWAFKGIVFLTIVYIFFFNNSIINQRRNLIIVRSIIYLFIFIVVLYLSIWKVVTSASDLFSIYFIFFLIGEMLFIYLYRDPQTVSKIEISMVLGLYVIMIFINIIDFVLRFYSINLNLMYGIGFIGLFFPFYFMIKYMELKQNIRENLIMINEIINKEKKSYTSSIYMIVNMLESKNNFIKGHSERVSFLASLIAAKLGMSEREMEDLQNACLLHDIGYIGISFEKIVNKGVYSINEFEQIKKHPVIGAETLSKSSVFSKYSEAILYHHENWNGTGYPSGLKGKKIPIFSRIIQIADNFDIITTDKFYRSALSKEDAMLILKSGKGEEFDPELVDIFIKSIKI